MATQRYLDVANNRLFSYEDDDGSREGVSVYFRLRVRKSSTGFDLVLFVALFVYERTTKRERTGGIVVRKYKVGQCQLACLL